MWTDVMYTKSYSKTCSDGWAIMEQYLSTQLGKWRVKQAVARGIIELECKVHTQIFEIS